MGDAADSSRGAERDGADSSRGALGNSIDWRTLFVTLSADDFRLETAGQTFLAQSADIKLHSDPGTPNEYTTLEATWTEHGARISLYIYFASNGKDWWASEFALFDVLPEGREVRSDQQAFRRPLGQAFVGDFDLSFPEQNARLLLRGLRVQAFIPPPICQSPIASYAFEILSPTIEMPVGLTSGVSATLRDANCKAVTSDFRLVWSVDDPTIVSLSPASVGRVYLDFLAQGKTTLRVKAKRFEDDVEVASVTMEVIVGPPSTPWEPGP